MYVDKGLLDNGLAVGGVQAHGAHTHALLAGAHAQHVLSLCHDPSAQRDFCVRVFNADC